MQFQGDITRRSASLAARIGASRTNSTRASFSSQNVTAFNWKIISSLTRDGTGTRTWYWYWALFGISIDGDQMVFPTTSWTAKDSWNSCSTSLEARLSWSGSPVLQYPWKCGEVIYLSFLWDYSLHLPLGLVVEGMEFQKRSMRLVLFLAFKHFATSAGLTWWRRTWWSRRKLLHTDSMWWICITGCCTKSTRGWYNVYIISFMY